MAPVDCLLSRTWAPGTPRPEGSSTRPDNTAVSFCASKTHGRRIAHRRSKARTARFRRNSRFDILKWTPQSPTHGEFMVRSSTHNTFSTFSTKRKYELRSYGLCMPQVSRSKDSTPRAIAQELLCVL